MRHLQNKDRVTEMMILVSTACSAHGKRVHVCECVWVCVMDPNVLAFHCKSCPVEWTGLHVRCSVRALSWWHQSVHFIGLLIDLEISGTSEMSVCVSSGLLWLTQLLPQTTEWLCLSHPAVQVAQHVSRLIWLLLTKQKSGFSHVFYLYSWDYFLVMMQISVLMQWTLLPCLNVLSLLYTNITLSSSKFMPASPVILDQRHSAALYETM